MAAATCTPARRAHLSGRLAVVPIRAWQRRCSPARSGRQWLAVPGGHRAIARARGREDTTFTSSTELAGARPRSRRAWRAREANRRARRNCRTGTQTTSSGSSWRRCRLSSGCEWAIGGIARMRWQQVAGRAPADRCNERRGITMPTRSASEVIDQTGAGSEHRRDGIAAAGVASLFLPSGAGRHE
jgi:hypothetical protein